MSSAVRQNNALSRFELDVEGQVAFVNYRLADDLLAITYVEVPRILRQHGVGSRLMVGVLETARMQGLKVRPLCSFARFAVAQHPEFHDVRVGRPACGRSLPRTSQRVRAVRSVLHGRGDKAGHDESHGACEVDCGKRNNHWTPLWPA
jgi:predicted GNAT family acetyltransferase